MRNLFYRAAQLMLDVNRVLTPGQSEAPPRIRGGTSLCRGVTMHLSKRIPHGGGLGGGSSDRARTLLGLDRLMGMEQTIEQLAPLATQLGSDVPFFLHGPSSICQGRGEIVEPIARPRPRFAVLILPEIAMPTPRVYQVFDSLGLGKAQAEICGAGADQPPWQEWTSMNADELLPRLINDLEAPAFTIAPQLGLLRTTLEQALGRIVRMSGSGSTLFSLFDEEGAASKAVDTITRMGTRAITVELGVVPDDDLVAQGCAEAHPAKIWNERFHFRSVCVLSVTFRVCPLHRN